MAITYNNLGNILSDNGDNDGALKNYLAALKTDLELGDKYYIALDYLSVGFLYHTIKKYDKAI